MGIKMVIISVNPQKVILLYLPTSYFLEVISWYEDDRQPSISENEEVNSFKENMSPIYITQHLFSEHSI